MFSKHLLVTLALIIVRSTYKGQLVGTKPHSSLVYKHHSSDLYKVSQIAKWQF